MELRSLLSEHKRELATFFRGDSFDSISTAIYRVLLIASGRDGETCQGIRDAAYDCMGVLGALDPDRFKLDISETPVLLSYNFGGYEESSDFAICLIQTSLISAYKTTTDTRHQAHLAYAIQELLKFCGFSPELFDDNIKSKGSHSLKVRERWRAFPQHMLDTIAPLLEGRYVYPKNLPVVHFPHPVYINTSTYRQWLQRWAIDLLGNVLEAPEPKGSATDLKVIAVKNSKIIFGAFHSVLKSSQDVGVAHHLLPHLILYLLFSKGGDPARDCGRDSCSIERPRQPQKRSTQGQTEFECTGKVFSSVSPKWMLTHKRIRLSLTCSIISVDGCSIRRLSSCETSVEDESTRSMTRNAAPSINTCQNRSPKSRVYSTLSTQNCRPRPPSSPKRTQDPLEASKVGWRP